KPLDAERVGVVRLVHEDDLDVVDVGVHRYMGLGKIGIDDAAKSVIDQRFLVQRHADTPDHPAQDLTGRGLDVQDPSGGDGADDAGDADDAKLLVDLHFSKDRRVRVVSTRGVLGGVR